MAKKPDPLMDAKIAELVRRRSPKTMDEWEAVAAEIPMADVLAALGIPEEAFYPLSDEQRAKLADLVVLRGMPWQAAMLAVSNVIRPKSKPN